MQPTNSSGNNNAQGNGAVQSDGRFSWRCDVVVDVSWLYKVKIKNKKA